MGLSPKFLVFEFIFLTSCSVLRLRSKLKHFADQYALSEQQFAQKVKFCFNSLLLKLVTRDKIVNKFFSLLHLI